MGGSDGRREFRGVWFPAEVWLDSRLTALEKIILLEVDSLDGEDGCYASNEYLAKFCQCSQAKVSAAISKLKKLGYVRVASFDGRTRVLHSCLQFSIGQPSKIYESASEKDEQRVLKENPTKEKKKERKTAETFDTIIDGFTEDLELREALRGFLQYRVASARRQKKEFTNHALKLNLTKLKKLSADPKAMVEIVNQTVERGWSGFYELKDVRDSGWRGNGGTTKSAVTHEDLEDLGFGAKASAQSGDEPEEVWY